VRWWHWLIVWVALGIAMGLLAPDYNAAQTADDADAFRAVFSADERGRYLAAAIVDIFFAIAYALLAVSVARLVTTDRWHLRVIARGAAGAVVFAAICDEIENVLVMANIVAYEDVDDAAIERMGALYWPKWGVGLAGAGVLLVTLVLSKLAGRREQRSIT
jgi:hypothetical protein